MFNQSYVEIQNFYRLRYRNLPFVEFDKHFYSTYFYIKNGERKEALIELSQIDNKSLKLKFLSFICKHFEKLSIVVD